MALSNYRSKSENGKKYQKMLKNIKKNILWNDCKSYMYTILSFSGNKRKIENWIDIYKHFVNFTEK